MLVKKMQAEDWFLFVRHFYMVCYQLLQIGI
jgi:hypothetical protein